MLDRLTPGECFEHPGLHHRLQHRIALHYRLYGLSNCFASRVLRQITTSSSLDRGHDGTVVGVSGQDDDAGQVGTQRLTSNPSLVGPDSSVPPTRLARSRRPVNPKPPDASAGFCRPRLETVSVAPPAAYRSRTFTSSASACLRTFVRAS